MDTISFWRLQESDEEEILDAETLQKRRDRAAAEWRRNSTMTAEENPNFEVRLLSLNKYRQCVSSWVLMFVFCVLNII